MPARWKVEALVAALGALVTLSAGLFGGVEGMAVAAAAGVLVVSLREIAFEAVDDLRSWPDALLEFACLAVGVWAGAGIYFLAEHAGRLAGLP